MKNELELLLNDKTKPIWKSFRFKYNIDLIPEYDYYITIIERKIRRHKISIYYDINEPRPDYFAHELLHILIHKEGYVISRLIDKYVWNYPCVCRIWNRDFRNLIENIIDHDKMYPKYLDLGFNKYEFVRGFNERKCTVQEIQNEVINDFHPNLNTLSYITAKYFLMKGTFALNIDYSKELKLIYELSPKLFRILDEFWNSLSQLNPPYSRKTQVDLVNEFFNNLEIEYLKVSQNVT